MFYYFSTNPQHEAVIILIYVKHWMDVMQNKKLFPCNCNQTHYLKKKIFLSKKQKNVQQLEGIRQTVGV